MRVTTKPATTYRVGSQDGEAHFSFFMAEEQLSFVWDSHFACPIEVEHGGYGEVLIASVQIGEDELPSPMTAREWSVWFATYCEEISRTLKEVK